MVTRNRIASVIVWGSLATTVLAIWSFSMKTWMRTIISEHCQKKLLGSVENIFGDRNHPFVFQHDNAPAHTARRTVAWLEQKDISTIQWLSQPPELNMIEQFWDFMGREIVRVMPVTRNDVIRALYNSWLNITVPYLHNLYNSLPWRERAVVRGRCYPIKYWLKRYFRKKDNISICLIFPERNIILLQIMEME